MRCVMRDDKTPAQIHEMTGHVAYELAAMQSAQASFLQTNDRFAAEAFLLHARSLAEFFSCSPNAKYPDNCRAADFVDEGVWKRAWKALDSEILGTNQDPVNCQVHHLSWLRIDQGKRNDWHQWVNAFPEIRHVIERGWYLFIDQLSPQVADDFKAWYQRKRREVGLTQ